MSISESIKSIFDFEKQKELEEELLNVEYHLTNIEVSSKILIQLEKYNEVKTEIDKKTIQKWLQEIKSNDVKKIHLLSITLAKIAHRLNSQASKVLKERSSFHSFILKFNLSKKLTLYSREERNVIEDLIKTLENLSVKKYSSKEIKSALSKVELIEKANYLDTLDDNNAIHSFIKIYYQKLNNGKEVTLSDVSDIIKDLAASEINNKIRITLVSK